eukprot:TRINITY_DN13744_c0_g1_i2.p1 TRINITY_DN13744_c0_g1~~TRINITY_DN13744_c0_g1_i2.p1  ORF type:complete len:876 (+),score=158.50 TRINITY_DN13744_c0_g1_i2:260-2887(+)
MAAPKEKSLTDMLDGDGSGSIERSSYLRSHSPTTLPDTKHVDGTAAIGLLSMGKGGSSQIRSLNDPNSFGIVGQYDDDVESDETATRREIVAGLRRIDPSIQNPDVVVKKPVSQPASPQSQGRVADILLSDQLEQIQYEDNYHNNNNNQHHHPPATQQSITPKVGWLLGADGTALPQKQQSYCDVIDSPRSPVSSQHQQPPNHSTGVSNNYNNNTYNTVADFGNRAEQSKPLRIAEPKRQTLQLPTFMPANNQNGTLTDDLSPHRINGVSKSPHRSPTRVKSITKEPGHSSIRRSRTNSLIQRSVSRSPGRGRYSNVDEPADVSIQYGKPLLPPSPEAITGFQAQEAPVIRKKRPKPTISGGADPSQRDILQHDFNNVEVVDGIWDPVQFNGSGLSPHEPVRLQRSASIPLNIETVVVIDEDADRLEQQRQIQDLQMIRALHQRAGSLSYSKSPSSSPARVSNGMTRYPKPYRGEPYGYGYSGVKSPPHQVVKSPVNSPPQTPGRSPPRTPLRGSLGVSKKTPPSCLRKSPPIKPHHPIPGLVQKGCPTRLPGNQSMTPIRVGSYSKNERLPYGSPNDGAMAACSISPTSSHMSPARISPNLTFTDKDNKKEYTLMFVERSANQVKSVNFDEKSKIVHINNTPIQFGDRQYDGVTNKISPMLLSTSDPTGAVSPRGRIQTPPPLMPVEKDPDLVQVSYVQNDKEPPQAVASSPVDDVKSEGPVPTYNSKTAVTKPVVTSPIASNPTYGCKTSPSSPGLSRASSGDLSGLSYGSKSFRNNASNRSITLPVDSLPPPPLANSPNQPNSKVHNPMPAAQALGVAPSQLQGSAKSNAAPNAPDSGDTARMDVSDSNSQKSTKAKSEVEDKGCCSCCTVS